LLYWVESGSSKTYVARLGTPGGGFAAQTSLPGGNAKICTTSGCDATRHTPVFADFDGDGALDFFSLRPDSTSSLYVSRAAVGSRWAPRDTVMRFTNGLGAITDLAYRPMTNASLYRRDYLTRNESDEYGRGSAVHDLLAPIYLVAKASSSAPVAANPANMATLYYRYAGAKMQGGGRGFLGFREIVTIDVNRTGGFVTTATDYYQSFPYVSMPWKTRQEKHNGSWTVPACITGTITNACFSAPNTSFPVPGGSWFSESIHLWEDDTDSTGSAIVAFAPGVQAPVHVRTAGTDEKMRDPSNGAQTGRVLTAFDHGAYGNVTVTAVDTYTGSSGTKMSSVSTANAYDDNPAKWRLGRLTETEVTHERPGKAAVVRRSRFGYAMSEPVTGLLVEERSQPGGPVSRDLRKLHAYDEFGNRIRTVTCLPTTPGCDPATFDPAALQFHQSTLQGVHRYSRVAYDGIGRYPVKTYEPFWNGTNTVEKATQEVVARDIFGNVTHAKDVNGVETQAVAGALGRDYFTWIQTEHPASLVDTSSGVRTITTYRWCGSGTNLVSCPTGAKFRQQVLTTEAPTQWTWFDVLGRPIMKASASFNDGISNKDISAICSTYDAAGKPSAVSNPFFLDGVLGSNNNPTVPPNACSGRKWTTTTYDVLGRPTVVTSPDDTTATTSYSGLTTAIVDQRGNPTFQTRNGKGELVSVEDAHGLVTNYAYYADGSLQSVSRDAGRGAVVNSFTNDVLGRKIAQDDPDTGTSTFEYNALGELVAEVDAAGNRTEQWYDARGRVWRKTVTTGAGVLETQSIYVFDTAAYGAGQLASESITGTYAEWVDEAGSALGFSRSYAYDVMGRPTGTTTTIDGTSYTTAAAYDVRGRVWKARDASGRWAKTAFTLRGFTGAVCNSSAADTAVLCAPSDTYLQTLETDPWGHVVRERRGNSAALDVNREYWSDTGRVKGICAGNAASCNLMDEGYGWDGAGNLSSHQKETRYLETFTYDDLNRLRESRRTISNGVTDNTILQQIHYDALGNICRRLTIGWATRDYSYLGRAGCGLGDAMNSSYGGGTSNAYGAHQAGALVEPVNGHVLSHYYDARGNQTLQQGASSDRTLHYSAEGQAHEASNSGQRVRFWYGPDGQRYKRLDGTRKTLYLGNVEIVVDAGVTTVKRTVAGVMLQAIAGSAVTSHYLFHDQLGSLVRIASTSGVVVNAMDFLALGGRRNVDNQQANGTAPTLTTRGFTGHEMVDALNLVHMNGRIYDAYQGRFLQADPLVQAPDNAQSWNAYAYVLNNPLSDTDPTGMFSLRQFLGLVITVAAAVITQQYWTIGAYWSAFGVAAVGGFAAGYVATGSFKGGVQGAFTAALTFGVGWAAQGWDIAAQIGAQAVTGGVIESLQGGNFGHGFAAAGLTAAFMPQAGHRNVGVRAVRGALIGGTISAATGGKFANGAISGAIQAAMAGGGSENDLSAEQHASFAEHSAYNYDTALAFEPPSLPQWLVDGATGFGDGVYSGITFGFGDLSDIRSAWGIDGGVRYDSMIYRGTYVAGAIEGGATWGVGGLSGGSRSVFWSGAGNMERAGMMGRSLERTPIGSVMNRFGNRVPHWGWKAASCVYACNASGAAIKVGVQQGTIWRTIEQPILQWRGIPIKTVP
jgi:RHS repeat-associated protein